MQTLRKVFLPAAVAAALVASGCTSSNGTTSDTESTTSTSSTTTTVVDASTTTAAAVTTTAAAVVTNPPPTNPPTTQPQPSGPKVTQMKVDEPDCASGIGGPLTLKWQVTGNPDRVYVAIDNPDGPYFDNIGNSGSIEVPFTCGDTQVYYIVAIKGNQKDIETRTRS